MFSPRSSRGNVAIAALLMVVGVGALSLVVGSMHPQTGPTAYVAATTQSTQIEQTNSVRQNCEVGKDYVIREESVEEKIEGTKTIVKRPRIYFTIDGRTPAADNQNLCLPGKIPPKDRICAPGQWVCKVYYCKPDELKTESEKKQDDRVVKPCTEIGTCKAGESCDKQIQRNAALSGTIQSVLLSPNSTQEQLNAARLYADTLPDESRSRILGSFEQQYAMAQENEYAQAQAVENASRERDDALRALTLCQEKNNFDGRDCDTASVTAAQSKLDQEKQRLEQLQKDSQRLATVKTVLQPDAKIETPKTPEQSECNDQNMMGILNPKCRAPNPGPPSTFTPPPTSPATPNNPFKNLGNLGQLMGIARQALGLFAAAQTPSCTIKANPTSISQAGQSVTLSWTSQYAQGGNLSNLGQVGPSGSTQVQPQQTTTYTLQVYGYPQQQQTPYGTSYGQPQGQYIWDPNLGAYVYVQQQNSLFGAQNSLYGAQGALQQASCSTQVTIGAAATTTSQKPIAQLSCQPRVADVGMQVSLSFACQNAAAAGSSGFDTNGQLAGSAQATVGAPTLGSNTVTYGLTCSKDGQVDSTQCTVEINKTAITLVANPGKVKAGEPTILGWVSAGMDSCTISSPTLSGFTSENAGNTSVSGTAKSPALTDSTDFVLNCITKSGGNRAATTTVVVGK